MCLNWQSTTPPKPGVVAKLFLKNGSLLESDLFGEAYLPKPRKNSAHDAKPIWKFHHLRPLYLPLQEKEPADLLPHRLALPHIPWQRFFSTE